MSAEIHGRCVDAQTLGAFIEGRLRGAELAGVSAHIEQCPTCISVLRDAVQIGTGEETAARNDVGPARSRSMRRTQPRLFGAIAAAAAIVVFLVTYVWVRDPLTPLIRAGGDAKNRLIEPRLSGFPYRKPPAAFLGGSRNTDTDVLAARGVAGSLMKRTITSKKTRDVHAAGVAALIIGDLSIAVEKLTQAAAAAPQSAAYWSDVAAVHYQRGMDERDAHELVEAVAAADAALRLDPSCREALFNRALALDRLHLREQAIRAWRTYLKVDPSSEWAVEVRDHLAKEGSEPSADQQWRRTLEMALKNELGAPALDAMIRRYPEEARRWGEAVLLAEWANAELSHDAIRLRQRLFLARKIGDVLAGHSGERLLFDVVRAIDRCPSRLCRERLAQAHIRYDQGRQIYSRRLHISEALSLFRSAEDLFRSESSAMAYVAAYYAANCEEDQSKNVEPALERMLSTLAPRYEALRAQILWELGTTYSRQGRAAEARRKYLEAATIFERLGEINNSARMRSWAAAVSSRMGRTADAWRLRWEAFSLMRSYPDTLDEGLEVAARMEASEGRWRTSVSLFALALESPARLTPRTRLSAVIWGALAAGRIGMSDWARNQLRDAHALTQGLPDSEFRSGAMDDLLFVEAALMRLTDPSRAARLLEHYIEHCAAIRRTFFLAEACLERGRAARSLGDVTTALRYYERSLNEGDTRRHGSSEVEVIDAYYATPTAASTEMADILERQGRFEEAFAAVERGRGRLLFDTIVRRTEGLASAASLARLLANGTTVIEYLALDDRLVIFTIDSESGLRHRSVPVRKTVLANEIESLCSGLQENSRTAETAADRLARTFIEPIEYAVAGAARIVVIGDPTLQPFPVSALPDSRTGTRLEDRLAIVYAPSANVYVRIAARSTMIAANQVLVIGNPAFDRQLFPSLASLPESEREASNIGAKYSHARVLLGRDASVANVLRTIGSCRIAHIGAHAVVSRVEPAQSFIVLSPDDQSSGALYANDVTHIPLSGMNVVVLAGCSTAGRSAVPSELNSIALAFLAGGARTVIGTLWDVEDADAARFCDALHDELAANVSGAEALRRAQRRLRSRLPAGSIAAFVAIGAGA